MKEYPLLLNGDMVRAVLDGTKTQTRRLVNPQPIVRSSGGITWKRTDGERIPNGPRSAFGGSHVSATGLIGEYCPFGQVGDTLWVRETWRPCQPSEGKGPAIQHKADGTYDRKTDYPEAFRTKSSDGPGKWRPSIHMPRWASRLSLKITDIRVERVNAISEGDVLAEGITQLQGGACVAFRMLWDTIYGKQKPNKPDLSWAANPWVWAITFEVTRSPGHFREPGIQAYG